ncbi:MAG TPA: methyl-accepting chemotaxis protein [Turneriella sp.]|nr:methyl-accepting chemotaxis protein [Turneriella sp.]
MRTLLNQLKVRTKMLMAMGTILISLAYLTTQFYVETRRGLNTSRLEMAGIEYITPLQQVLHHVQRRRGFAALHRPGIADKTQNYQQEGEAARKALADLLLVHEQQNTLFDVGSAWLDFKSKLDFLLNAPLSVEKRKLIQLHTDTIQQVLNFQESISERSMLDLNQNPESYYLIELSQKLVAPLSEGLGRLRASASAYFTSGARDNKALRQADALFQANVERAQGIVAIRQRVLEYNVERRNDLEKAYKQQNEAGIVFQKLHTRLITENQGGQGDATEYFEKVSAYIDTLHNFSSLANEIVENNLASHHRSLLIRQWTVLVLTTLGVLFSISMGLYFLRHIGRSLDDALRLSNGLADGNLEQEVKVVGSDEIAVFMKSLQRMVTKLREVLQSVHQSSAEISLASQQVASTAEMLNNGAMDQAAHVEETGAALGEMVNLIGSNANNAIETDKTANVAMDNTKKGADNVMKAVESMRVISERIQIVQEIASQTNLLALNATIEAARAGEHGRGFAVVATEVGKLADTSGQAAKQIQELLHESSRISETAASSLSLITDSMQNTAQKVVAIRKASEEQDLAAKQINESMGRLNQTTEQTASAAEELAATAEEMSSQTSLLMENLKFFTFKREEAEHPVLAGLKKSKELKAEKNKSSLKPSTPIPTAPQEKSSVTPSKKQSTDEFIASTGEYEKF